MQSDGPWRYTKEYSFNYTPVVEPPPAPWKPCELKKGPNGAEWCCGCPVHIEKECCSCSSHRDEHDFTEADLVLPGEPNKPMVSLNMAADLLESYNTKNVLAALNKPSPFAEMFKRGR